jgi:hypothetical protein
LGATVKEQIFSGNNPRINVNVLKDKPSPSWFGTDEKTQILAETVQRADYTGGSPAGTGQAGYQLDQSICEPYIPLENWGAGSTYATGNFASGCGYGAGGGGGYNDKPTGGIDGIIVVKYKVMDYMRPDGTHYFVPYGGN